MPFANTTCSLPADKAASLKMGGGASPKLCTSKAKEAALVTECLGGWGRMLGLEGNPTTLPGMASPGDMRG